MVARLAWLGLGLSAVLAPLTVATDPQSMYPACPVNHKPEYYCCTMSPTNKAVYTKFNRPTGAAFEQYYADGWRQKRQINYAANAAELSRYAPDAPEYVYGESDRTCRMHDVVVDGAVVSSMQCSFAPSKGDTRFVQNTTLGADMLDTSVYWTAKTSPRNNNATFPIGATCKSLMLPSGAVDNAAMSLCSNAGSASHYYFNSGKETELVVLYVLYAVLAVLLLGWALVRQAYNVKPSEGKNDAADLEEGKKKLMDHRGGPQTPGNEPEVETLEARAAKIQQSGLVESILAKLVLTYFILMTLVLNVLLIILIRDNNGHFYNAGHYDSLFNPNEVLIKIFISLWVITTVWLVVIVIKKQAIRNFFRLPSSLATCTRVRMFKPEKPEVLLVDRSGVSQFVARVEDFLTRNKESGVTEVVDVKLTVDGLRYIEFQHLRYTYDDVEGRFVPGSITMPEQCHQIAADAAGLSDAEFLRRQGTLGRNAIEVSLPSILQSIVDEFFTFFYIYQLMCYYVWYFTDYTIVAAVNIVVILVSALVHIFTKRSVLGSVVKMTHYVCDVEVQRDGEWKTIKSDDLVPGDLVRVAEDWEVPCDLAIVQGATVCDESMLTGESVPVQKFPIPADSTALYDPSSTGKKYTLFSGTKTLASGRKETILAVVHLTGAHTTRGQLVQSILYPAPMRFKYDEHLKLMLACLFLLGLVAAYFAMSFLINNAGLSNTLFAFIYGMFMLSGVLNPLLPVVITIGQVNAAKRLTNKNIFCLNPQRITLAGKVRIVCFDKTGTITKQGLDFIGCKPVVNAAFTTEVADVAAPSTALSLEMKYALASCHSVGSLNGTLVGNEVEVKMFAATKWALEEKEGQLPAVASADGAERLEVVKRFEFDHNRMCMSVVMQHATTKKLYVFAKGSYETIGKLSVAASVPSDYTTASETLAKNGCYVLGVALKELAPLEPAELQALVADRDAVESGLSLLGLIMFRNELKEDSRDAILKLKAGNVRPVMITGDNALTGCYIARESGMVSETARILLADVAPGTESLVWTDVETNEVVDGAEVEELRKTSSQDLELAVTGAAFNLLIATNVLDAMLHEIRIFGRMTPAGKIECVRRCMASGAVTGMCGDGGNDCGALRIAHVGVALSEAEASVVSPFTSKSKSLESVVDVCIEGRGALATSFGSVKYLIMYGLIGIGLRFVMYSNSVFVSQFEFIYLDGVILVGISYAITRSKPLKKLGTQRPTSSLIGPTTIVSLLGAVLVHVIFLYIGIHFVMTRPWYCPFSPNNINLVQWWLLQDNVLGCSLWIIICFQQAVTGITCSLGSRYRRSVWHNKFLVLYYVFVIVFLGILVLGPPTRLTDQFRIATSTNVIGLPDIPMPKAFRWELFGIGLLNTAVAIFFESFVVQGPVRDFFRKKYHHDVLPLKL